MNDREFLKSQMLGRVQDFGKTYAEFFPPTTLGGELLAVVGQTANQLSAFIEAEITGGKASRQGTSTKAELRAEIRGDITDLIRTVRSSPQKMPNTDKKFRMPRNFNDKTLIGNAQSLVKEAARFAEELVRRELPADFLEKLGNKVAMFEEVVSEQNNGTTARVSARAAIDEAIARGMEAMRELDAIVRNKFRNNPTALAAWTIASHIERPPKPAKKDPPAVAIN